MPADRILYWEYKGNRAVRQGDWKLVAERARTWELYNLSKQGTEMGDLAVVESKRRDRLAALYDVWAAHVGARSNAVCEALKPSTQPR